MPARSLLKRFIRREDGSVAIVAAFVLPIMIGIVALVAEFGYGLLTKAEDQRIADISSYAGALAYSSSSSTTTMTNAAKAVAALNGITASNVSASLISSPKTSGSKAVSVVIASNNTLVLAKVLQASSTLAVSSGAAAEIGGGTDPCIIALSSAQTGVTLSGGTTIKASACAVASNNTVSVPCGTTLQAKAVNYNSAAAPSQPCSGIVAPSGGTVTISKVATADPLASNTAVSALRARLSTVASQTVPAGPAAPVIATGTDLSFGYQAAGTKALTGGATGCSQTSGNYDGKWVITCTNGGTYTFGSLNFSDNSLTFNTAGTVTTTYNFSGSVSVGGGATATFGPGIYRIAKTLTNSRPTTFGAGSLSIGQSLTNSNGGTLTIAATNVSVTQGISNSGGSTLTLPAGTYNLGRGVACGSGTYSICNSATMTIGGPSIFTLPGGVYNGGGSTLTLGSGTTNSFQVGPSSDGNALYVGGGANTTFADATGQSSVFQLTGNFATGGGACTTLSAATQHDIAGSFNVQSGVILGSGIYTLNGYFAAGDSSGGATTCNGSAVGINGANVTMVVSGTSTPPGSGNCAGYAFCAGAGFNNITLTAPTSGTNAKLAVIGPASPTTAGANLTSGASGVSVSGTFYFPNGPVTLSGGASLGNGTGQCLEVIGSNVTLTGGTAVASTCITGGSTGGISLVQ